MHKGTKRAAAISAAVVGVALIGSGCSEGDKDKDKEATTSTSTSTTSVEAEPSTSTVIETAGPSTQMTGTDGKEYTVSGPILEKYNALDEAQKTDLGKPTGNVQTNPDGGSFQQFDGGVIVHTTKSYVVWGKIRDKWNELGGSQGKLGYPTSDETETPDGGKQTTFEHGVVTWKEGDPEATVTEH
jgi:uncharacterized protein with LGFP repeats